MIAIGLMSGTSLDGVDAVLVEINEGKFHLLKYILLPYDLEFKERIFRNAQDETAKLSEICSLNVELGYRFCEAIDLLLENSSYTIEDISFVASHGQTIWHQPKQVGKSMPSTLQIGDPNVIAYRTGITVVSDFRPKDIAAGGEGAPLVPMSEYLLFQSDLKNRALQNLGGIGNVTYIPKNARLDEVVAFDTGPGNMIIDYFVQKYFQLPYDEGGAIALSGKVIPEILNEFKKEEYLFQHPPKSTGRERYSKQYLENIAALMEFHRYDPKDIIATVSEYTVYSLVYHYKMYLQKVDEVILSGGGSHNNYLITSLRSQLTATVLTAEEFGIVADAKEAIAFVVLGYLTLQGKAGNVPSATGAKDSVILGSITPGKEY